MAKYIPKFVRISLLSKLVSIGLLTKLEPEITPFQGGQIDL